MALAHPSAFRAQAAWAVYDWANSAFPTVITTFVFAAYFTKAVAENPTLGTAQWSWAVSLSALAVAIMGPVLGAVADRGARLKPWLLGFTYMCVVFSAGLWFVKPDVAWVVYALVLMGAASFCFEMGVVFYNAFLPTLAKPNHIGRLSGWAWGLGYFGGLACLGVALVGFVQNETPWFGLSTNDAEHVRATTVLVAVWMGVFAVPIMIWTPDKTTPGVPMKTAVREGLATLWATLRNIRQHKTIARFLLARMIYTDGLNTLFAFGGIYAGVTFGMSFEDVIIFGIAINVASGLGAVAFGWVDDWMGAKKTILIALLCLMGIGAALVVAQTHLQFWVLGLALGVFVGPAQAASRSLMARIVPRDLTTEMFGLYALSGKATAFVGPLVLGWASLAFDSQRAGMATILVFFAIGGVMLWRLEVPQNT